jgi:ABC-type Fe3+/spermidine/putrescine transport system ATPase subunit
VTDFLLEINNLYLSYNDQEILSGLNIALPRDRILTILGPSGCGKTTLLRVIAGLQKPDSGTIIINGNLSNAPGVYLSPQVRNIGLIFQTLALWPHMTVQKNIELGLKQSKMSQNRRKEAVENILGQVHLNGYQDRLPHSLSIGEQQRVALARCLVLKPKLLLLDEPFAHLDWGLRQELIFLIKGIQAGIIFVTHDQLDAFSMGELLAIMDKGRLLQVNEQKNVLKDPATDFVKNFLSRLNQITREAVFINN